jgi:hypothetical protein
VDIPALLRSRWWLALLPVVPLWLGPRGINLWTLPVFGLATLLSIRGALRVRAAEFEEAKVSLLVAIGWLAAGTLIMWFMQVLFTVAALLKALGSLGLLALAYRQASVEQHAERDDWAERFQARAAWRRAHTSSRTRAKEAHQVESADPWELPPNWH